MYGTYAYNICMNVMTTKQSIYNQKFLEIRRELINLASE